MSDERPPYILTPRRMGRLLGAPMDDPKDAQKNWTRMRNLCQRIAENPPAEFQIVLEKQPYRLIVTPRPGAASSTLSATSTTDVRGVGA